MGIEGKENYSEMDENVTNTEETVHEKENEQTGKAAGSCLPLAADQLDLAKQYKQMMLIYEAGIRQLTTKLQILNREFEQSNDRNPIENIKSRIKSAESIAKKMERKGLPMTLSCLTNNIYDIAGIRVICPFITDVYEVARMLLSQTDVELVQVKDYIREPKENGYRSLHLIVQIPIYLHDQKKLMKVEVQFRTISMDWWASLEHKIRYKKDVVITPEIEKELRECAEISDVLDRRMEMIQQKVENEQN